MLILCQCIAGTGPTLDSINGGQAQATTRIYREDGESDLDLQLAIPIIYPQTTTLYQSDDEYYTRVHKTKGFLNTFFDAIDGSYCNYSAYGETGDHHGLDPTYPDPHGYQKQRMCGTFMPTNVISVSYGMPEHGLLPESYQRRLCVEFLKLGLRGVSILFASGDDGVGSYSAFDAPGITTNGCLRDGTRFSPIHPSSCPWLTNVGGIMVYPGYTVHSPESALNQPFETDPHRSAIVSRRRIFEHLSDTYPREKRRRYVFC